MRAVLGAALISALLPAAGIAQSFQYAPGSATYRITQTTKATQEAMGQKQDIETTSNQVVSVTVSRAGSDTVALNLVLDSISSTNSMGMPSMTDRLIGMKVAAKISPTGRFYAATGPTEEQVPNASAVVDAMGRLLPSLRGRLTVGTTWTDTTTGTMKQQGLDIERKVISRYTVAGDTTIGNQRSLKIQRSDNTVVSGSGNSPNGPMTMEGSSKGEGTIFVSPTGTLLAINGTENATIKIVLAANGMEVGITQAATTKLEKIR